MSVSVSVSVRVSAGCRYGNSRIAIAVVDSIYNNYFYISISTSTS